MKKITILALHLSIGGVENVISNISNMLIKKYNVEIISVYKIDDAPAFHIDSNVTIKYLLDIKPNKKELSQSIKDKKIFRIIKESLKSIRVLYLRRKATISAIKKIDSDIIISTRCLFNGWLGKYGKKECIKIAQEHNHHNNNEKNVRKIIKSLKNIRYFMPASKQLTEFYKDKLKGSGTTCVYIPNALEYFPECKAELKSNKIISVGRLSPEKGFKDLIDVFDLILKKNHELVLNIVGNGTQYEFLQNYISQKNLNGKVILCGFLNKEKLNKLYSESSLYIMTSFTESFGLVLLEAESYGIPLIAFDSAQGANEIIENGQNGYLIPNRDKTMMAEKSIQLMQDIEKRKSLGEKGREKSTKFTKEEIGRKWYEFIENILQSGGISNNEI